MPTSKASTAVTTSAKLASNITDETGTGALVFATNPTLVTPALGTPQSGVLTNATGLPVSSVTGLATNVATFLGTSSSANLGRCITDETGTGVLVFSTNPALVTPALGTPQSGVLTNCTGTAANLTAGSVTGGVFTTGNQTIGGTKSFTGNVAFNGATAQGKASMVSLTVTANLDDVITAVNDMSAIFTTYGMMSET
jgi:hypothetical protein